MAMGTLADLYHHLKTNAELHKFFRIRNSSYVPLPTQALLSSAQQHFPKPEDLPHGRVQMVLEGGMGGLYKNPRMMRTWKRMRCEGSNRLKIEEFTDENEEEETGGGKEDEVEGMNWTT
ncbi:hypothetical protein LQV05_000011 [Cryptococcus neoformans]|nr:hypothetical protein LQV05_000011 [Cryptococcus neoformans]